MTLKQIADYLRERDNFLIVMHKNPDGDCVGSATALCLALHALGKQAYILPDDDMGTLLTSYTANLLAADNFVPQYTVAVDAADSTRFNAQAPKHFDLAIDHHASHKPFATHTYVDGALAACGEIVYQLIIGFGVEITQRIAESLYVAIATDTGCFKFGSTTPNTHRIAAALMETNFDFASINRKFFEQKSLAQIKLEQAVYADIETFHNGTVIVLKVTLDMLKGLTSDDTDSLPGLARAIAGCQIGILIREQSSGEIRVSVRTVPPHNASDICAKLGGGGHKSAAGATFKGTLAQAREAILAAIEMA
ncbi:MAG: bifunctional oligoribonuclease/PAP phosphatase NrnA [Oscillospiraceae bacterium]|nr:bifunctional oligoribonuclease/PAP phosphatase NrnA [Oscillospiraceae bacterium]